MNRRVWTASLASVVASVGLAAGQTAPSTATEGASNGVVTLRTAGQPDRKLQVLKSEKMPDGKILTEVKDLSTGVVFTIADTKPFANVEPVAVTKSSAPVAAAPLPMVAPAPQSQQSQPTMLPGTQIPAATSTLPGAKPRSVDPLLGGTVPTAAGAATTAKPRSNYENVPAPQTEYPTLIGKLRGNKDANTVTTQPAPTNVPPKQSAISAALFGTYPVQSQPTPTVMDKVTTTKSTVVPTQNTTAFPTSIPAPEKTGGGIKSALFGTPNAQPTETPTLMGKLFGDKTTTQPTTTMTTVTQASAKTMNTNVIRPNSVASSNSRIMTPTPQVGNPQPLNTQVAVAPAMEPKMSPVKQVSVNAPTITMPAMPTAPAVERASYAPVSTDAKDPNFHVVAGTPMTMKQIEEQVKELRMNQRPSKRMDAATMLATGPMANMVEVRQILAEASYRDPVGVVRAHCIDLLSKMKYDEYNYKQYVETLVNDEEPAVQRAARNAMK